MDSFNFHFERVGNLDLHPLSCPLNRLSPARSTSGIDQFNHQHGKGDSAYSSFSGGSNAPDYSSPFIQEEITPHSVQYSDLNYVKAVYHPNDLYSGPKNMEKLCRSMPAISQQCDQRNSFIDGRCHNQESPPPPPPLFPPPPPPAPPSRLDSFTALRNLENSRVSTHPEGQVTERSRQWAQAGIFDAGYPRPDPIYGRRISQPNLRDHVSQGESRQVAEPQRPASAITRAPPAFIPLEGSRQQSGGSAGQTKTQKQRRHSVQVVQTYSTQHETPTILNSSIQHKGQFYFVTGVCKPPDPGIKDTLAGVEEREEEQCSEEEPLEEPAEEKRKSHSKVEELLRNHLKRQNSWESQGDPHADLPVFDEESPSSGEQRKNAPGRELSLSSCRHHSSSHRIFYCGPDDHHPQVNSRNKEPGLPLQSLDPMVSGRKVDQEKKGMKQPFDDVAKEKISKENTPLLYHLTGESRGVLAQRPKTDNDPNGNLKGSPWNSGALPWQNKEGGSNSSSRTALTEESQDGVETPADSYNTLDESFRKYYKEKLKDAQSKVLKETSYKRWDLQLSLPLRLKHKPEKRPSVLPSASFSQGPSLASESSVLAVPEVAGKESLQESARNDWEESVEERFHEGGKEMESNKETALENWKESGQERGKEGEKENGRPPKLAQPQVPRIGGRRRLTPEQKKMCYSEPGKLHLLGEGPVHTSNRSLGNERESLLSREDLTELGLVASRRKVFEVRGRARSASCLSRATLKEIRHKALVAYMVRKKSIRMAEPQQPALLNPDQGHSLVGKPSDWSHRPLSGNTGPKEKLLRPLSAGRILDSSSSSARYLQFVSAQPSAHNHESSWKESTGSAPEKSASAESLLDEPELPEFFRARSTSTPHTFRAMRNNKEVSPQSALQRASSSRRPEGVVPVSKLRTASVSEFHRARLVAPRGKSLEELATSQESPSPVLSKSADQLDQLRARQGGPGRGEKMAVPSLLLTEAEEKPQMWSQRKQDSSLLNSSEERGLSRSPTPANAQASGSYPQDWAQSASSSAVLLSAEHVGNDVFYDDPLPPPPPPPQAWGSLEQEPPTQPSPPKGPNESRTSPRLKTAPLVHSLLIELPVEDQEGVPKPDSSQEASLSPGVTTDPNSWLVSGETGPTAPRPSSSPTINVSTREAQNSSPIPGAEDNSRASTPSTVMTVESSLGIESDLAGKQRDEEGAELEAGQNTGDSDLPTSSAEEAKSQWEELVEEVVAADQSLACVLCPVTNRKTAVMLMEQLLSEDTLLMEEHYRRKREQKNSGTQQAGDRSETKEEEKIISPACESPDSDVQKQETPQTPEKTGSDVTEKKKLLVSLIEGQLQALEGPRAALQDEVRVNGERGAAMDALVRESCLPAEHERYALFVGDLERVVSLLLCLSARLARVQNALSTVDQNTDEEEKKSLHCRHNLLRKQREDAKDLKENLDRRERVVSAILAKHLTPEQLQDYRHFVQTKAAILIQQKDLEERQRLGQEQLESLLNSIPT